MTTPFFIATERFSRSDGKQWQAYFEWARIPALVEVVSLDGALCPRIVTELSEEDWSHTVCEDYRLYYFWHLDYLMTRVRGVSSRNILGVYRNPSTHSVEPPAKGDFEFLGFDLIDEQTQISALTNCGGFPDVFRNEELNRFGLIDGFGRACEVRRVLAELHPEDHHAQCEMYAIWRLKEAEIVDGSK